MGKATEDALADLHGAVAAALTNVIENGVVVAVKEDGTAVVSTAPAAYFAAALAMLKNNNVTADPGLNKGLSDLRKKLAERRDEGKAKMADATSRTDAIAALERELGGMLPE